MSLFYSTRKAGLFPAAERAATLLFYTLTPQEKPGWMGLRSTGKVYFTRYSKGIVVHHEPLLRTNGDGGERDEERAIKSMSENSRKRAAFALGNADCRWVGMTVLTWHEIPPARDVKKSLKRLQESFRRERGEGIDAWGMEIQKRGCPHFHLFHSDKSAFGQQLEANLSCGRSQKFADGRVVCRGNLDRWLVRKWLAASHQENDADAVAFHEGGIIEPLRNADGAGRYMAPDREAGKKFQKELPACYAGLGRWWFLHKSLRPVPLSRGLLNLDRFPFEDPYRYVWDSKALSGAIEHEWKLDDDTRATEAWAAGKPSLQIVKRADTHTEGCKGELTPLPLLPTFDEMRDDWREIWPEMAVDNSATVG